jgi:hypothetical protein
MQVQFIIYVLRRKDNALIRLRVRNCSHCRQPATLQESLWAFMYAMFRGTRRRNRLNARGVGDGLVAHVCRWTLQLCSKLTTGLKFFYPSSATIAWESNITSVTSRVLWSLTNVSIVYNQNMIKYLAAKRRKFFLYLLVINVFTSVVILLKIFDNFPRTGLLGFTIVCHRQWK